MKLTPLSSPALPSSAATPGGGPPHGLATLPRELANFLVELSIAMHKHAIYPPGHPLLDDAVNLVLRRLGTLLADRPTLSIGVARRQIIIEGVATDPNHPLLQELAQRLHRHHLGAVKFMAGVGREELADALSTIAVEASRMPRPLGMDTEVLATRWPHVRLFALTYEKLELLGDEEEDEQIKADRMRAGRAAQLWVGLARAALAAELTADDDTTHLEPASVARAIDEHHREQAYDQVIVGYLLQIANELKSAEGSETAALQKRISRMVETLQPETLARLLEMGGDVGQRRRFLLDATQGMTLEAVVDLVRAAADTEHQNISHSMVRMLSKLAKNAEHEKGGQKARGEPGAGSGSSEAVRDVVGKLIGKWSLDDPNPGAYREVLETMARSAPEERRGTIAVSLDPERLVMIGLEVGTLGAPVWRAVDAMTKEARLGQLLDILERAPDPRVADSIWDHLAQESTLRTLLSADRIDFPLVQRFVARKKLAAIAPLLDAVETAEETKLRERLYDLLVWIGTDVGPAIVQRLESVGAARLRELLVLLGRLPALPPPPAFDARNYLMHPESTVRREAVKLLLKNPDTRDDTLVHALSDPDDRTVYLALMAAQERCPRAGIDHIRGRVERGELDAPLRALGIRAAASVRTPETLRWLIERVVVETKWLRRPKLLPQSPEVLAALTVIALGWGDDPAAHVVLALARKSNIAEIRSVVK